MEYKFNLNYDLEDQFISKLDSEVLNSESLLKEKLDFTVGMEGKNPSQIKTTQTPTSKPNLKSKSENITPKNKESNNK